MDYPSNYFTAAITRFEMKKEKYYRQTFDYWMDWMTKPEDQRSPMERIGCFVNIYSLFEYRLKSLVIEDSYENQVPIIKKDQKKRGNLGKDDYRGITPKEYKEYKGGDLHILGATTMKTIQNTMKFGSIFSNQNFNFIVQIIDFRNSILHQTMFRHKEITDEKIEELIKGFRIVDARLKSLRRSWKRMKKIKTDKPIPL